MLIYIPCITWLDVVQAYYPFIHVVRLLKSVRMSPIDTSRIDRPYSDWGNAWIVSCKFVDPPLSKGLFVARYAKDSSSHFASSSVQEGLLGPLT